MLGDIAEEQGSLFDLLASLRVTLGGVSEEVKRLRQERASARANESSRFVRIHGKVTLNSSGFGVIAFDNPGPHQGFYWYVRKLVVGGVTTTTTTAGRADVFVSASDLRRAGSLAEIGLADWQDQATTLPLVGPYGDGELTLKSPEALFVVVSGGTASQDVYCSGTVKEIQDSSAQQSVSV